MGGINLLALLGRLTTWKVTQFAKDSDGMQFLEDDREPADITEGANVVSSQITTPSWMTEKHPYHAVLLDLDVPAHLVPSSTHGHSHLYIDVSVPEPTYFKLLDALADCGVIERGYATASKNKGGTFLRMPWVKK